MPGIPIHIRYGNPHLPPRKNSVNGYSRHTEQIKISEGVFLPETRLPTNLNLNLNYEKLQSKINKYHAIKVKSALLPDAAGGRKQRVGAVPQIFHEAQALAFISQ